ncbi:MFS transporter [Streptomyces canus]|uniref:MFS transporter n=1 Tax=Streptomyces canus TaxID=58343 RepID=UPI0003715828|nr:MFS transporter [Streptomyces canus]
MNVLEQVKNAPMSRVQVGAVALCLVISLIDGFDLLVASFVGPTITREWSLSPSGVGLLLSGGLAGMAVGALFLAPFVDRIGRRRLSLGGLALASLGMLAASLSQNFGQLLAGRLVTGAAVGAMAVGLPVLASAYANRHGASRLTSKLSTA